MAGNEWINGYLEAILDAGAGWNISESARSPPLAAVLDNSYFNPTKYFVDEVVTGYDETDLYRTWTKVVAMRNSQERNTRLENLCWRIWHLTRRKKQAESDEIQRLSSRRIEREQGRKETTDELSDDLSDMEKDKAEDSVSKLKRNLSELEMVPAEQVANKRCLYMVLISLHGLVRGENMELGRDSDTGGQVKYVVELVRALAKMPEVYRVDLLTRQITSPDVHWSYGEPTEMLTDSSPDADDGSGMGESSGAYIVRIPCGPRDAYLRKELLWPYIQEFVDASLIHILNMAKALGDQINNGECFVWPHVIHGHYADAGDIAALLSGALNVPMVLTGHSLGRNKLEQLLKQGRQSREDINSTYKIMRRIEAEELSLDAAELVITSTQQEIDEQWGLYDGFDSKLEKVLRARLKCGLSCHGRYMPRMVVMPPGMDFSNVNTPDFGETGEADIDSIFSMSEPGSPLAEPPIWLEIRRFFTNPHKPMLLALARPDPKKNITTLVTAFGECKPLRDLANLTLIMGNRGDIDEMTAGNASVLTTVLKLIDKYDLYGQVAYPKHHKQSDVPDIYRLAARTKGVFINPALVEPFGLTLIEAGAHGLPTVATRNGGPVDIHRVLNNGLLVDPHDPKEISDALLRLVSDRSLWADCRSSGLRNINLFSWPQHCRTYLARIAQCRMRHPDWKDETADIGGQIDEYTHEDSLRDVSDISLRLSLDDKVPTNGESLNIPSQKGAGKETAVNRSSANGIGAPTPVQDGEKRRLTTTLSFKQQLEKVRKEAVSEENDLMKASNAVVSSNGSMIKLPHLRRRKKFVVIAVDAYDLQGQPAKIMVHVIQEILKLKQSDHFLQSPGFILSTAMTLQEILGVLQPVGLQNEFDALICSSGSELYYHASNVQEVCNSYFLPDPDYSPHIEYRWGGEGLRKTMARLLGIEAEKTGVKVESSIMEDEKCSSAFCLSYKVKDATKVLKVDELRKKLRMRGLRCHVIYCQNGSTLHVLPLLASRAQALRYLFVRWGIELCNMYVLVGDTGDTDYEELLSGVHKTLILSGSVESGCDQLLRGNYSYHRDDIVPLESHKIVRSTISQTNSDFSVEGINDALSKLG